MIIVDKYCEIIDQEYVRPLTSREIGMRAKGLDAGIKRFSQMKPVWESHPGITSVQWISKPGWQQYEIEVPDTLMVKVVFYNEHDNNQLSVFNGALGVVTRIEESPYAEWILTVNTTEGLKALGAPEWAYTWAGNASTRLDVFVSGQRNVGLNLLAVLPEQEPEIGAFSDKILYGRINTTPVIKNYRPLWNTIHDLINTVRRRLSEVEAAAEEAAIAAQESTE